MISSSEFKKALGPEAQNMTDPQIEHLLLLEDRFADSFFESWLESKNIHKNSSEAL